MTGAVVTSPDATLSSATLFFRSLFFPTDRILNDLPNFCFSDGGRVGDSGSTCWVVTFSGVRGRGMVETLKGAGYGNWNDLSIAGDGATSSFEYVEEASEVSPATFS